MPKVKKREAQHLFTVFGFDINISAVLTTVAGSVTWLLISTGLTWIHDIKTSVKTDIPQLKSDVVSIKSDITDVKSEQKRIKKEYAPDVAKK